jgi:DNA-binding NarL/FixJ family response regulator
MKPKPIRVLLADDHTLVRAGIRSLLGQLPGITVLAEAADGREALQLAAAHQPDVVVMDIAMPGLNGLEATLRLRRKYPGIRVIMLSMHANEEYVFQALQAGATGYLLKKSAVVELEAALRAVHNGKTYLSRTLSRRMTPPKLSPSGTVRTRLEKLTARQREVLQLIAESRTTKEMALDLGLSAKTVEFHRIQLMKRLGIFDVPGLVRYALRAGLAEPET